MGDRLITVQVKLPTEVVDKIRKLTEPTHMAISPFLRGLIIKEIMQHKKYKAKKKGRL